MAYFLALGILSLAGIVGTLWLVHTDGYGRIPTDPSRVAPLRTGTDLRRAADPSATSPAAAPAVEAARPSVYAAPAPTSTGSLRAVAAD